MARRSMQDFKNHKQMHHASGDSLIADNLEPKMMQSLGDIKFKPKHKQASSISHLDSALDGDLVTVDAGHTAAESNVIRPGTRAKSALSFETLGTGYTVPRVDHSYKVKHRFKMGNNYKERRPASGYMAMIEKRAKITVDPRKYSECVDWEKLSKRRDNFVIPKKEKITVTTEHMREQKPKPGPHHYDTTVKHKIYGTYGGKDENVTFST